MVCTLCLSEANPRYFRDKTQCSEHRSLGATQNKGRALGCENGALRVGDGASASHNGAECKVGSNPALFVSKISENG